MANQNNKLTLIFEADTAKALANVTALQAGIDKLTNKQNSNNESIDLLFDIAIARSQLLTKNLDNIASSVNRIGSNNIGNSINNWAKQGALLEKSFSKALVNVQKIGETARRELGNIPKSLEVKINAATTILGGKTKTPEQTYKEQTKKIAQEKNDNQEIRRHLDRKLEKENAVIKENINQRREKETKKADESKAIRERRAESIISKVASDKRRKPSSVPVNDFFTVDSQGTYKPPKREIISRRDREIREQVAAQTQARKERSSTVFGSESRSVGYQAKVMTEIDDAATDKINQRLKAIAQNNKNKAEEKARIEAEKQAKVIDLRQELASKKAQKESDRLVQNQRIKESSKKANDNRLQSTQTNRGMGFGASNFGKLATARTANKASVGSVFSQVGGFGLQQAEMSFGTSFQQISQGTQQLGKGLSTALGIGETAAFGLGAAISLAVVGGLGIAIGLASNLAQQFDEAKKDQLSLLGISSETQRLFGVDSKTADNFYEKLQIKSEIAGRDTSVETKDITDLNTRGFAAFLNTFKDSGESLDTVATKMVDINTRYAILAQATPGVTNFQIQNAYTSAVTGNLGKAITTQEFFRNSGFAEVIKEVAAEKSVNLMTASRQEQVLILEEALKRRVPQSLVDRAQNDSIGAQTSSFGDRLFAARIGYFGIQRDTDLDKEGTQSVFSELTRTVKLILGKGGLFDQIGRTLGFIDFDLMDGFRRGIELLNNFLMLIVDILDKFNNINQAISSIKIPFTDIEAGGAVNTVLSNAFIPNGVLAGNIAGGIKNTASAVTSGVGSVFSGGFDFVKNLFGFGNSFTGNIPDTLTNNTHKSIFQAIATEKANAPINSNLVIANDSEYIFKDKQQLSEYTASSNSDRKSSKVYFNQGAIVINSNSNPQAIAQMVIQEIDKLFNYEKERYF